MASLGSGAAIRTDRNSPIPAHGSLLERLTGRPWGFSRGGPSQAFTEPYSRFRPTGGSVTTDQLALDDCEPAWHLDDATYVDYHDRDLLGQHATAYQIVTATTVTPAKEYL